MADNSGKVKVREIIKDEPLWDKGADTMSKLLFPRAISPKIGIAKHARFILWALVTFNKMVVQLPRYHGKSSYVTFLYVMWVILTRRKKYILIISATGKQAMKFLMRIRVYLTSSKVHHYYGSLDAGSVKYTSNQSFDYIEDANKKRSKVWNYREMYIEPWGIHIMATSIASANRGLLSVDDRPDLVILDDIEDRKNTNTPELRDKLSDTIVEEIFPGGQVGCQFIVIGTICHYGSFILKLRSHLLKDWFFIPITRATDTISEIKKINDLLPDHFPDEFKFDPQQEYFTEDTIGLDGKLYRKGDPTPEVAVWQEMYSYEYYCKKRAEYEVLGKLPSFWQEYYNIPKSNETRVFTEFQYLEGINFRFFMDEAILESTGSYIFPNGKKIVNVNRFLGGDLAVSDRESADWRVFFTVFTDPFFNVYVLPPYFSKEPDPFVIGKWVLDNNINYKYNSATFDSQHFQKWFKRIVTHLQDTDEVYKNLGVRLTKFHEQTRSEQKESVIISVLSPIINGKRLYFLGKPDQFTNVTKELMYLGYYDSDDFADGLSYACSNLRYPDLVNFDLVAPRNATLTPDTLLDQLEALGVPEEDHWMYL
jgi:hypothetical protein